MSQNAPFETVILAPDEASLATMRSLTMPIEGITLVSAAIGSVSAADALLRSNPCDLLLVGCNPDDPEQATALISLCASNPDLDLVLFVPDLTSSSLKSALRIGAREVIALNGSVTDLQTAISRIEYRREASRTHRGRIHSFISCKGGSGATFISTNLAYSLSSLTNKRVLLIDLNLQFGDAILYVSDCRPTATIADLVGDVQRLDSALLRASVVQILPNFWLIPAPSDPAVAAGLQAEDIGKLLRFAKTQADLVLIDLGRKLDATTLEALDQSDSVFMVVQQTLPYVRDARRMLELFRSLGYSPDKVKPILNRFNRNSDITLQDIEDALGTKLFVSVPNDYKVASAAINQGVPVHKLSPGTQVAKGLQEFAVKLGAPPYRNASWLSRVLKHA